MILNKEHIDYFSIMAGKPGIFQGSNTPQTGYPVHLITMSPIEATNGFNPDSRDDFLRG